MIYILDLYLFGCLHFDSVISQFEVDKCNYDKHLFTFVTIQPVSLYEDCRSRNYAYDGGRLSSSLNSDANKTEQGGRYQSTPEFSFYLSLP